MIKKLNMIFSLLISALRNRIKMYFDIFGKVIGVIRLWLEIIWIVSATKVRSYSANLFGGFLLGIGVMNKVPPF